MMNWHEYVAKSGMLPEWPYPVNYGKENIVESDVLVVGGGVAGCRAAIEALKKGATVAVAPAKQRISTIWKRKDTGAEFRVGMKNPPSPNTTPPSSNR